MKKRSYLSKSRFNLALVIGVFILISEVVLFFTMRALFDRTVLSLQERGLKQAVIFNESLIKQMEKQAFSIAATESISRILNKGYTIERDYTIIRNLMTSLSQMENRFPTMYAPKLFFYSRYLDGVFSSEGFIDLDAFPAKDQIEFIRKDGRFFTWCHFPGMDAQGPKSFNNGTLIYSVPIPLTYNGMQSFLVINMNTTAIQNGLELDYILPGLSFLILNEDQSPISLKIDEHLGGYIAERGFDWFARQTRDDLSRQNFAGVEYYSVFQKAEKRGGHTLFWLNARLSSTNRDFLSATAV